MPTLTQPSLLRTQAYVGGRWQEAYSGRTFPVYNPATGEVLAEVADCGPVETNEAIAAAEAAFPSWRTKTAAQRANLLWRWYELILEHVEDLALLMTLEQGKPLAEARGEVRYGASFVEWFAEEARRAYGEIIPPHSSRMRLLVFKEPIGVVAAITPWNFPHAMITRKVAPALAAGCTVVVKPSEETPLSALALAELAERAGFPPGVFNVVTGLDADAIGRALTESPAVRKLSFTGSTAVGKLLMRRCADTVKKISLELGGNAPFIVFDDADVDAAVEGAIASKFRNTGQTCICANRIFVQNAVYEAFVAKFTEQVRQQKMGSGLEPGVTVGPLINQRAIEKVERLLSDALEKGARVLIGGVRRTGTFFEPTVVCNVRPGMNLLTEEIFGPIAPIIAFDSEEEVIRMANDTIYGLAAYFYGRDVGRIFRVAEALEYGMIGVNTGILGTAVAPFGGMKQSGIGREGSHYGLEEFLEIKYVCLAGL
ncbi:MAG: NAD-dependent succinate-semialdehyde dehydrogenase [Saprospiraceae bacterium]|nr:NAD-dependent succinate-semialdehyde dehydrogenase [Saprospiraceae bacterium]MDW8485130.1 NAD-dependent succinate-semialdehyde dehydrogenase [Saprospiraceae bacterium]